MRELRSRTQKKLLDPGLLAEGDLPVAVVLF